MPACQRDNNSGVNNGCHRPPALRCCAARPSRAALRGGTMRSADESGSPPKKNLHLPSALRREMAIFALRGAAAAPLDSPPTGSTRVCSAAFCCLWTRKRHASSSPGKQLKAALNLVNCVCCKKKLNFQGFQSSRSTAYISRMVCSFLGHELQRLTLDKEKRKDLMEYLNNTNST